METITANLIGKTRRSTLNGREYIVAPMTLIVPGVLPGSKGPLYYPQDELAKDPHAWNHMPVVVNHPFHNGRPVSARRPDIIEKFGIGFVFNTEMSTKLIAEGWFDVEKTRQVDGRILTSLEAGTPLELSTGLFTKDEPAHNGAAYNGTPYVATARDYRPDHLAILPDQQGACGIRDGCGVLVNSIDPAALVPGDITERVDIDGEPGWRVLPVAPVGGWHQHAPEIYTELTANTSQVGNELSHSGIDRQLEKALWARFNSPEDLDRPLAGGIGGISPDYESVPWLVEVFDEYVVYSKDGKTWALGYTVDHSNNQVSLEDGEPEEVTRVTDYVPVKNDASTQNAGKKMPSRSIKLSPAKACKILKDGQVNGRPLTKRQRGLFGAICGRGGGTRNAADLDSSFLEYARGVGRYLESQGLEVGPVSTLLENANPGQPRDQKGKFQTHTDAEFMAAIRRGWGSLSSSQETIRGEKNSTEQDDEEEQRRHDPMSILNSVIAAAATINAFCKTGPGGGIDPHCKPGGQGGGTSWSTTEPSTIDKGHDIKVAGKWKTVASTRGPKEHGGPKDAVEFTFTDKTKLMWRLGQKHEVRNSAPTKNELEETVSVTYTDQDRTQIRSALAANCGCKVPKGVPWKDMTQDQINRLDDETLNVFDRWNQTLLEARGGQGEGGFHPNNDPNSDRHVWNSRLLRWETIPPPHQPGATQQGQPPAPTGNAAVPPPPPPAKPKSMMEALEMFGTPEDKMAWNSVLEAQNREKMNVIEQLMYHITDETQRTEVFNELNALSTTQLRTLSIIRGPQGQQQGQQEQPTIHFFGGQGAPAGLPAVGTAEEPLQAPVYNFDRSKVS